MTNEQIIRWMVEHGTDLVRADTLYTTWASRDLQWDKEQEEGFLQYHGYKGSIRLTDFAINKLKEREDGIQE